jgi:hypothetical protein
VIPFLACRTNREADIYQILFLGSSGIRGLDSMFAEQESSLTNMVELDRARKPRVRCESLVQSFHGPCTSF